MMKNKGREGAMRVFVERRKILFWKREKNKE
jgi:hypothetical protein